MIITLKLTRVWYHQLPRDTAHPLFRADSLPERYSLSMGAIDYFHITSILKVKSPEFLASSGIRGKKCICHMTRTAPCVISVKTIRKKLLYEDRTRQRHSDNKSCLISSNGNKIGGD